MQSTEVGMRRVVIRRRGQAAAFAAVLAAGVVVGAPGPIGAATPVGIHRIKHVVVIMQENRSFDSYFGTFPGAEGLPMRDGAPTVCVPEPKTGTCILPYIDHADVNGGGPHGQSSAIADIDGG